MGKFKQNLGRILLWKFDRRHLAYDLIVILILLFIFLIPKSCFERKPPRSVDLSGTSQSSAHRQ